MKYLALGREVNRIKFNNRLASRSGLLRRGQSARAQAPGRGACRDSLKVRTHYVLCFVALGFIDTIV